MRACRVEAQMAQKTALNSMKGAKKFDAISHSTRKHDI